MLKPLAGGIAHLQGHHCAADPGGDLAGHLARLRAAREAALPLFGNRSQGTFEAPCELRQSVGMLAVELLTLPAGVLNIVHHALVGLGEFLDGLAGACGELRDVGGEDSKVLVFPHDSGGGHPGIDGDDAHHLDGASQLLDRRICRLDLCHEMLQLPFLVSIALADGAGRVCNRTEAVGGLGHLAAFKSLGQGVEDS